MTIIAAATSLSLGATPAFAAIPSLTPVHGSSEVMRFDQLADCHKAHLGTDTGETRVDTGYLAGAQLGWQGKPSWAQRYQDNGFAAEVVPVIPCHRTNAPGKVIEISLLLNILKSGKTGAFNMTPSVACYSAGAVTWTAGATVNQNLGTDTVSGVGVHGGRIYVVAPPNCGYISEIRITYSFSDAGTHASGPGLYNPGGIWVWKPVLWKSANGGWVPATDINDVNTGVELPIVCAINNTGADIFEITSNVVGSIFNWIPCMVLPVGWDRASKIDAAWNTGATGNLKSAYEAAIPDSISCGVVATVPVWGHSVVLNTCAADFAPAWGKAVLSWVFVLGTALLTVRRIMWAVGSRG